MDAILERIELRLQVDMLTGCHRWTGMKDAAGYGLVRVNGRRRRVHREVYERATGEKIPCGHVIDHVKARGCAFRDCCNVAHLEPVTVAINSQRVDPWNRAKTHCPAGHRYDNVIDEQTGDVIEFGAAVYRECKDGYVRRFCRACGK